MASAPGFGEKEPSLTQVSPSVQNAETSKSKGGRPRGATLRASMEKEAKREALINDIATTWSEKVEEAKSEKKKNEKASLKT